MGISMVLDNYNFAQIVENSLLRELKPEIAKRITDKLVKELEKDIKKIVEAEVDKLVISGVEHMKDQMNMRDEIKVYMEWKK